MRNSFIRVINQLDPNEFIIQSDWPIVSFYPIASFLNQNAGRLPSYALSIQTMLTLPAMRRSMSQESADCDRVTITWENKTFFFLIPELDAQFEIPHPGLQKKTWTHVSSYFVEVDKNLCSCSMALGFFPLKDKNQLGIIFGTSSFRLH